MIKPAYSVSFLLSINIFVWQNVLYFLDAPRIIVAMEVRQLMLFIYLLYSVERPPLEYATLAEP